MENTTKSREKKQKDKYDHSIADIFIENATVITLDEQRRVIRDGGVVIEGNRIKDIGKSSELQKRYKAARIINGKDRVILPGFIDSHVHANQSFVKSLIHGEPYLYWSRIFRPFEYVMTEEDSYIATLLHILTSIRMGITCFVENRKLLSRCYGASRSRNWNAVCFISPHDGYERGSASHSTGNSSR